VFDHGGAHEATHAHAAARLHVLDRLAVRLEDGVELGLRDQPLAHARLLDREHRPLHRLALKQAVDGPGGAAVEHFLELAQEEEAHVAVRCGAAIGEVEHGERAAPAVEACDADGHVCVYVRVRRAGKKQKKASRLGSRSRRLGWAGWAGDQ
jgi:hypothetical protein